MYNLMMELCKLFASFQTVWLIVAIVAINIAKLVLFNRQDFAVAACAKFGFAMTAKIVGVIAYLSMAMYAWSVYFDRSTGKEEKHFLIAGFILLAVSIIFAAIAKSVKLIIMNIIAVALAWLSGSSIGVALDKWPFIIALVAVIALDSALIGIAFKLAEDAPTEWEIREKKITEKLIGINKQYFGCRKTELPSLSEQDQIVVASCSNAPDEYDNNMPIYQRTWIAGTVLWYIDRKGCNSKDDCTDIMYIYSNGSVEEKRKFNAIESSNIYKARKALSAVVEQQPGFQNNVLRITDAANSIKATGGDDPQSYLWDAAKYMINVYPARDEYTDEFIEKRNKDIGNEESIKSALTDLREFFLGAVDMRYIPTDDRKIKYLRTRSAVKRRTILYGLVCIVSEDTAALKSSLTLASQIKKLESEIMNGFVGLGQMTWSTYFIMLNGQLEKGGDTASVFREVLNDWDSFRPGFKTAMDALRNN